MTEIVVITYRNHRDEISERRIVPLRIEFGIALPWHPQPQWLLYAYDEGKEARRTFAMKNVLAWNA